jgi:ABC-type branched-subunit amino acid transport system substrate-binding protein
VGKKSILVMAAVGALALGLTGCAGGAVVEPTATPTPVAPTGDGVLRIGDMTPITGPMALYSSSQVAGIELAAREVNEAGGYAGVPVEVLHRNAGDEDPAATEASFNDLLSRGVDVIIAPASPTVAKQLMELVEKNGSNVAILSIAAQANAPEDVTVEMTQADEEFIAKIQSADPGLTDVGYGVEAYDAAIAAILAATAVGDDGGESIVQGLIAISNRDGFVCTGYGMCASALTDKQDIDYVGVAGQFNYVVKDGTIYFTSK